MHLSKQYYMHVQILSVNCTYRLSNALSSYMYINIHHTLPLHHGTHFVALRSKNLLTKNMTHLSTNTLRLLLLAEGNGFSGY